MQVKIFAFAAAIVAATVLAVPTHAASCPKEGSTTLSCGSYTISGYHKNKVSVQEVGGSSTWLAIGMLETSTLDANYTYGDGKSGDAANFGFMKNNWYMYRTACSEFKGQSSSQYNNGAVANAHYSNAVHYANECWSYFGSTHFWEVQRGGQSRIGTWNSDTDEYYQGVNWIQQQGGSSWQNDTRWWVSVPAI
jgi:hypothetical protein